LVRLPALFLRELGSADIGTGTVRDLSDGGACVMADEPLPAGTDLYVGLFLNGLGDPPLIAMARVLWAKPGTVSHTIGLTFSHGGAAQRDAIERLRDYLAQKRPNGAPA
jgi:hypothetical protein